MTRPGGSEIWRKLVAMSNEDLESRFRTHVHYIEGFAWLAGLGLLQTQDKALPALKARVDASGILADKGKPTDINEIRTRLRNAWGTELLLAMSSHWDVDDEFVRLTNTWGVVQTYYVGYHVTQALILARGDERPSSHPKTQSMFSSLWTARRVNLPPWTLGYSSSGATNVPSGVSVNPEIHGWSRCNDETSWSLAAKALRTSRNDKIEEVCRTKRAEKQRERRKAWSDEERARIAEGKRPRKPGPITLPRLTVAEKLACERNVRAYTLLDYLYRLRIRANYEDAALFTDGPTEDVQSMQLHRHLRYLAASTSLVTELRVRELVGRQRLVKWADDFISHNVPPRLTGCIAARRDLLATP